MGQWAIDKSALHPGALIPRLCGQACDIAQDDRSLIVTQSGQARRLPWVGEPDRAVFTRGELKTEIISVAKWERDRLLVNQTSGQFTTSIEVALEGDVLVISEVRPGVGGSDVKLHGSYRRVAKKTVESLGQTDAGLDWLERKRER
ncbi:MAG: hypothetical protein AMXMBFR57_32430 [Acidimicrobiia bacterium]